MASESLLSITLEQKYQKKDRCTWICFWVSGTHIDLKVFKENVSRRNIIDYLHGHLVYNEIHELHIVGCIRFKKRMSPRPINTVFSDYNNYFWGALKTAKEINLIKDNIQHETSCLEKDFVKYGSNPDRKKNKRTYVINKMCGQIPLKHF